MYRATLFTLIGAALFADSAQAMFNDDPWLTKVAPELEIFEEDGETALEWDVDIWSGRDLNKFWLKSEGEQVGSELEHANIELVFSQAVSAYWDRQFGVRQDFTSDDDISERSWLSFGFMGTAVYFVDVDARLFVGEESSTQLFVELEREFMLTQEWVLVTELDLIANGRSNPAFGEGSGLAELEFALKLGYEHEGNRQFKPFAGLVAEREFGATRSMTRAAGGETSDTKFVLGLEFWF